MSPGRILKDLLYGELVSGKRKTGRPHLRYKDVCQRDMRAASINATGSGKQRIDPPGALLSGRGKIAEERRMEEIVDKRARRKAKKMESTEHVCKSCDKDRTRV